MTVVRLSWNLDTPTPWNEVCARTMEVFGLPGDRYITHPTQDYLEFTFKDPEDATLFLLEHTGQITIEVVKEI